jgi:hypothetical protein
MLLLFYSLILVKLIAWPDFLAYVFVRRGLYSTTSDPSTSSSTSSLLPTYPGFGHNMRRWRSTCLIHSSSLSGTFAPAPALSALVGFSGQGVGSSTSKVTYLSHLPLSWYR